MKFIKLVLILFIGMISSTGFATHSDPTENSTTIDTATDVVLLVDSATVVSQELTFLYNYKVVQPEGYFIVSIYTDDDCYCVYAVAGNLQTEKPPNLNKPIDDVGWQNKPLPIYTTAYTDDNLLRTDHKPISTQANQISVLKQRLGEANRQKNLLRKQNVILTYQLNHEPREGISLKM